jgi:tetraacyldisaccharide 4'-kinase
VEESPWLRIARGEARGARERLAGAGLWALSVGYGVALKAHLAGYRLGLARRRRFPVLVISVGNLTVGGTGKTTAALAVARWLLAKGRRVAFLSRGYRGAGERRALVVSEGFGPILPVRMAGDEAYMVARAAPELLVLVGKDRRRTGAVALEQLGAEALVLDDGFQYQRLARDLDVVLVDALMPFGYDFLVPRGLLREPLEHLRRADSVWLTHSDLVRREDLDPVRARLRELVPGARLWETIHRPVRLRRLDRAEGGESGCALPEADPEELSGRRVCALSGLGNPFAFERGLEKLGAELVARLRFPDHYPYREEELRQALAAEAPEAEWIVTTEKDAVRLPEEALDRPAWALEVELAGRPEGPTLAEELDCLLRGKNRA